MGRRQVVYQRKTKQNSLSVWMVGMIKPFYEDAARKLMKYVLFWV
jgi:hypothetical protein